MSGSVAVVRVVGGVGVVELRGLLDSRSVFGVHPVLVEAMEGSEARAVVVECDGARAQGVEAVALLVFWALREGWLGRSVVVCGSGALAVQVGGAVARAPGVGVVADLEGAHAWLAGRGVVSGWAGV